MVRSSQGSWKSRRYGQYLDGFCEKSRGSDDEEVFCYPQQFLEHSLDVCTFNLFFFALFSEGIVLIISGQGGLSENS